MLKYFLIELMTPIVCLLIFYFIYSYTLNKFNKRGWLWGALFVFASAALMAFAWIHAGDYSKELQCVSASYPDAALNPNPCSDPDDGINALVQTPMLITIWAAMAAFVIIRLRPSNFKVF